MGDKDKPGVRLHCLPGDGARRRNMKKKTLAALVAAVLLSGCGTFVVPDHRLP